MQHLFIRRIVFVLTPCIEMFKMTLWKVKKCLCSKNYEKLKYYYF